MKFSKLMLAAAALLSTMGASVAADAKDDRRGYNTRYERGYGSYNRNERADRDRRYDRRDRDRRYDRNDRDRRREWRGTDRRRSDRNGNYGDVARRNYEYERDLQTCYRNGRRICP